MIENFKIKIQQFINKFGYRLSKLEEGVSLFDSFTEQKRLVNKNIRIIFDIGAANGRTSLNYHNHFTDARIFSFEPLPNSYEELVKNVKHIPSIVPLNLAVCDEVKETTFNITSLDDSSSLLEPNVTGSSFDRHHIKKRSILVNTTTIDQISHDYKIETINLLKMDAQGAEGTILDGAKKMLNENRIELIYTECQFMFLYKNAIQFYQLNDKLEKNNFRLFNLFNMAHNQFGQLAWGDAIFINKDYEKTLK